MQTSSRKQTPFSSWVYKNEQVSEGAHSHWSIEIDFLFPNKVQRSHFALWFLVCCTICQVFLSPLTHIYNDKRCISGTITACCLTESTELSITHHDPPDNLLQCHRTAPKASDYSWLYCYAMLSFTPRVAP